MSWPMYVCNQFLISHFGTHAADFDAYEGNPANGLYFRVVSMHGTRYTVMIFVASLVLYDNLLFVTEFQFSLRHKRMSHVIAHVCDSREQFVIFATTSIMLKLPLYQILCFALVRRTKGQVTIHVGLYEHLY